MWLGHLQQLLFFQAADGEFVDLHLDAGLLGEITQQLAHGVVVRVRGDVDGDGAARVFGIAVLRLRAAEGQAGAKHGDGGVLDQLSALHGRISWGLL